MHLRTARLHATHAPTKPSAWVVSGERERRREALWWGPPPTWRHSSAQAHRIPPLSLVPIGEPVEANGFGAAGVGRERGGGCGGGHEEGRKCEEVEQGCEGSDGRIGAQGAERARVLRVPTEKVDKGCGDGGEVTCASSGFYAPLPGAHICYARAKAMRTLDV